MSIKCRLIWCLKLVRVIPCWGTCIWVLPVSSLDSKWYETNSRDGSLIVNHFTLSREIWNWSYSKSLSIWKSECKTKCNFSISIKISPCNTTIMLSHYHMTSIFHRSWGWDFFGIFEIYFHIPKSFSKNFRSPQILLKKFLTPKIWKRS